jgi:thiol-disulfide isomerase/thioredoxin
MRIAQWALLCAGCVPRLYTSGGGGDYVWEAPTNTFWDGAVPPEGLQPEGFDVGEVVPDLRLPDQHGDVVSLWQFYGDLIVLDVSTIWCGPCQELAAGTEATAQAHAAEGLAYITVLQQDLEGDPPDAADLNLWVTEFGITAPVLGDDQDPPATAGAVVNGQFPAVLLVDRELRVLERVNPADEATLEAAVEAAL